MGISSQRTQGNAPEFPETPGQEGLPDFNRNSGGKLLRKSDEELHDVIFN